MNALAQVRHLLVNDVRRLRWMLVGYVVVVVIAVISATSLPIGPIGWFQAPPLLVSLTGFLLVGSAVQADSPCRPDAFWMSRPIQPFAVLGAKLVLGALVVALPLAASAWSLSHLGFPPSEYWPVLGRAASSFAGSLLLGMAIAAVTRDLRSFANTAVLLFVLGLVALAMLYGRLGFMPGQRNTAGDVLAAAGYLGPLALLVFVYWRRDNVTMARIAGVTMLAGFFLIEPFTIESDRPATRNAVGEAAISPHVSVALVRVEPNAKPVQLLLMVTGTAWRNAARLVITPDSVLVHVRDGSIVALRNRMSPVVVKLPSTAPESLPWRDVWPDWPVSMTLSVDEVRALAPGVSSIEIVGRAEAYALNVAAVLPFESGPRTSRQGALLQLDSVRNDPYGASAAVTMFAIQHHQAVDESALLRRVRMGRVEWALPRFQLVDDSTHVAIRLASPSTTGSTDVAMVLPGANLTHQWAHVQTPLDYTATDAAGRVRRVHFLYLEWEYVGSARVRARSPIE